MKKYTILFATVVAGFTMLQGCKKNTLLPEQDKQKVPVSREKLLAFKETVQSLHKNAASSKAAPGGVGCYFFGTQYDDGFGKISCVTPSSPYCHDEVYASNLFTLHSNVAVSMGFLDGDLVMNQMVYLSDLHPDILKEILENGYFEIPKTDNVEPGVVEFAYEDMGLLMPSEPVIMPEGRYSFEVPDASESPDAIYVLHLRFDPVNGTQAAIYLY